MNSWHGGQVSERCIQAARWVGIVWQPDTESHGVNCMYVDDITGQEMSHFVNWFIER